MATVWKGQENIGRFDQAGTGAFNQSPTFSFYNAISQKSALANVAVCVHVCPLGGHWCDAMGMGVCVFYCAVCVKI